MTSEEKIAFLEQELEKTRAGGAKVVYALDRSCQLIDALLAWLPTGQPLSPGVEAAHGAWREAMKEVYP